MNGKQVITRLKAAGWTLQRISGSHHILVKDARIITVPVHGTHDLAPGTLASIARQCGIPLK
jgi:predicted RNA binding protein YcfA (HicA-like mRNA interferase family)